jgi:hypothetical protein
VGCSRCGNFFVAVYFAVASADVGAVVCDPGDSTAGVTFAEWFPCLHKEALALQVLLAELKN